MTQHGKPADQDLRIPHDEFERLRNDPDSPQMQSKSFDLAYELLVEGKALSSVAKSYGVTRQRALAIRNKIYASYILLVPEGWKWAQICAPQQMIERFQEEINAERAKHFQAKVQSSTGNSNR